MKHYFQPVFAVAAFALLSSFSVQADTQEKMVIALKTSDFELTETDISTLAVGEAQTIETESGKIIDILRTADGAEIYVDGELLEMDLDHEGLHEQHMMEKHVEIVCNGGEECDESIIVLAGDVDEAGEWLTADGEDIDIENLHETHESTEEHKIIVIKKVQASED